MDWPTLSALLNLDEETWRGQLLPEVRLGQILLRYHLIDAYTLEEALAHQPHNEMRLGEILVAWGHCTPGQISRALARQFAETRMVHLLLRQRVVELPALQSVLARLQVETESTLPAMLVAEGLVEEARLEAMMAEEYAEARLGQVLLSLEIVSVDMLAAGLGRQARTGERLGEAMIALGCCTPADVLRAIAQQGA